MDQVPDPCTPAAIHIFILILLTLINAFVTAAEVSAEECSRNKIKSLAAEGDANAVYLLGVLENPGRFFTLTKITGIVLCFASAAVAAIGLSDNFAQAIYPFLEPNTYVFSIFIVTLLTALFVICFGILLPKQIGTTFAESVALKVATKVSRTMVIMLPVYGLTTVFVKLLLKLFHQEAAPDEEFSEDDVMDMLEVGQESGAIKEEGKKMINSIFAFDDKLAYEIMTPRTDVFTIDLHDPPAEYLDTLMELRYSRIPVYEDDTDNIIGILNIKDFFASAKTVGFENVDIGKILRKPYFVPETKNIDSLFINLQSSKNQIAILIDEFGGFSGIVTMEDIIEEVMGDIEDEYDEQQLTIEQVGEDTYLIDGSADIDDINEQFHLNLESDNSETIGGLVLDILGEIPDDSENLDREIKLDSCTILIKSVKERRIEKVLLTITKEEPEEPSEDEGETEEHGN